MDKKLAVIVTGVGKGIGKELVDKITENGNFVYGIIRTKSDLKKFKNKKNCQIVLGDIKNEKTIKKVLKISLKQKRKVFGLVNNAGERQRIDFNKIKKKQLKQIFDINFFSNFYNMQTFSKYLIQKKIAGSIVNIGSIVGQRGFSQLCGYASTKSALDGLTKSFATEMAKFNIRANIVHPGFVKTSYYNEFKKNRKKIYNWTLSRIPQKKWGEPKDVSNLVCFLLSKESKYITGSSFNIDGGWLNS
tara:strand:+ start:310 stop:1047 length:738 start_codon:yes stop_codon:yes gene_type:complete